MRIFGLAGWSGSGKTTVLTRLLPELTGRGFSVSTLKHTHHSVDLDSPGKDTFQHREAGAHEVMLASASRWVLMHELNGRPEPDVAELAARLSPVDLLLVEGFKRHPHAKIEIYRQAIGKPAMYPENDTIVAVASDAPVPDTGLPVLDLDDIAAIADFILAHVGLGIAADDPPDSLRRIGGVDGPA